MEELILDTSAGGIALLHWKAQREDAPKVLCLHGWLDNAASFLPLAQHLGELDLYALDLPGHGHSDHRKPGVRYAFSEYLFDLDAVLESLGWDRVNFLGHSLGGGVVCAYSAAMPERVRRIVVVDGLGPFASSESDTTRQMRKSLDWARRRRRPLKRYESLDAIAKAREDGGLLSISEAAARTISERASRKVSDETGDYYVWRTDPALNWRSPVILSEGQILNFLGEIRAPLLAFHAQPFTAEHLQELVTRRQAAIRDGRFRNVEGNHHFHMDEAEQIAPEIEAFFLEEDA
jgi:pimeloyl-ACP methyl ester carboxylesterase